MTYGAALLLAFAAFAAIAASMDRHGDQFGMKAQALSPGRILWWRAGGFVLLGVSLLKCLQHWNTSIAIAAWLGLLTFAAMALGLVLTYAPHKARQLACCTAALGALLWLVPPL